MSAPADTPRAAGTAQTVALAALLLGACSIAFAPIFVRLSETGPTASAFWRTALAVPFLWAWAFATPRAEGDRANPLATPMLLAGLFFAGDLAVWHFSILFTTVANSTLLANLAPIFVTVGAWLLFGQRVTRTFLTGMAIAMAGAFVLVGPSFGLGERQLLGDALGVVTAMFYGAYMLAVKHLREARSTARIMAVSTTVCAVALLPLALASGETMLACDKRGLADAIRPRARLPDRGPEPHRLRDGAPAGVVLVGQPAAAARDGDALCVGDSRRARGAPAAGRRRGHPGRDLARAEGELTASSSG